MRYIKHGTSDFNKVKWALFAGGFNTFAVLYSTQPLMPEFSKEFGVSPTVASLSLSMTTVALAVCMLLIGSLSEAKGRKPVMTIALVVTSVLAMGLYISGNSIGGMGGRIITGMLTGWFDWRVALFGVALLSAAGTLLFWFMLPPSRNFHPRKLEIGNLMRSMVSQLKDPGLRCLYGIAFLLMGSFVTLYNYIGFLLIEPPYSLSQTLVGWIFIVYVVGTFSSMWMGRLADHYGRHVLGGLRMGRRGRHDRVSAARAVHSTFFDRTGCSAFQKQGVTRNKESELKGE